MWTTFANLKHNTSPAIDGDAFASAAQTPGTVPSHTATTATAASTLQRRRPARPPSQDVSPVSTTHSRRDPFSIDYGLWPFDDRDYAIVCTVTNHTLHTDLSLWTPLLTEDARRQACIQHRGCCCNCGSTEHSLRWCPAPFQNVFSLLNPELATHDPDGSVFETWKKKLRNWRRKGPSADTKVTSGAIHQVTIHHALTTLGSTLPPKVISPALCLLLTQQSPKPNLRHLRPFLPYHSLRPQVCVMVPYPQPTTSPTPRHV